MRLFDSLINFVTGLGTTRDPTTSSRYKLSTLDREQLEAAYRSDWVARRIVDAAAEDATREWRTWQADEKIVEQLEEAEKQFKLQEKLKHALIRSRLYGGGALVLGVDQGQPHEPLDLESCGKDCLKFVVVMNRYELSAGPRIYNVFSEWYTRPEYYVVQTPVYGFDFTPDPDNTVMGGMPTGLVSPPRPQGQAPAGAPDSTKQQTPQSGAVYIHPSRVIEFTGNALPDWRLQPMGGSWGDSILQTVDDMLKDWGMTVGGIANILNDAKMDVVRIPDFSKNMATKEYANRLLTRFALANQSKSMVNTLLLDKEEEWERIQTNTAGFPNLLREFMTIVAGAGGIPVSRLMGQSPGRSLNSTSGGETDIQNYYDTINAMQKTEYTPAMHVLDDLLIRSVTGARDPIIRYDWNPLYLPDPKEVAEIALLKAQATQADVAMALINADALRSARVTQLIEDGTYPGLEDAIEKFGEEPEEPEPGEPGWQPTIDPKTGKPIDPATGKPALGGSNGDDGPGNKLLGSDRNAASGLAGKQSEQILKIVHTTEPPTAKKKKKAQVKDFSPDQPRDEHGRWTEGGGHVAPAYSGMTDEQIDQLSDEDIAARLAQAEADLKAIPPTDQINTPEREKLRAWVVDTLYNRDIEHRTRNRQATIVLGLPGSGKSTFANPLLSDGSLEIEGDNAKALLPEFKGGVGAWAVHEEGSQIMRHVLARAIANGDNLVWPRIDSKDKIEADVRNLHKAGYTVNVVLVDTDAEQAAQSAVRRFLKMGRYVSPEMIRNYGTLSRESFEKAKETGLLKSAKAYKRKDNGEHGFVQTEG